MNFVYSSFIALNKTQLISRIKTNDGYFIRLYHRHLPPLDMRHIQWRLASSVANSNDELDPKVTVSGVTLTIGMLHQFNPNTSIGRSAMSMMLALLAQRDDLIMSAYQDINSNTHTFPQRHASLFCNPACIQDLLECDGNISEPSRFFNQHMWGRHVGLEEARTGKLHRIFFTSHGIMQQTQSNTAVWTLFIADFSEHKIYFINPLIGVIDEITAFQLDTVGSAINRFLNLVLNEEHRGDQWELLKYPYIYNELAQNAAESGLYIMAILYHLVIECPVYIDRAHLLNHARYSIALWQLRGRLPY